MIVDAVSSFKSFVTLLILVGLVPPSVILFCMISWKRILLVLLRILLVPLRYTITGFLLVLEASGELLLTLEIKIDRLLDRKI